MCIAEKPSVAKEIAQILGAKTRHNGYFEGNGYTVTWTFGHLCTLKEPRDYHEQLRYWNIDNLPILPTNFGIKLIKNSGVKEQFEVIKKLCSEAEEVINCGDAGQEGELIQRWVLNHAENKNPVKRLWISSLTEEAIREGFNNLKDEKEYTSLYYAGASRAIGDWLLGINATRLYTLKYAPKGTVLSIGRVQTPTLALIVNRQHEIDNFVSKDYWEIKTKYRDVIFSSELGKVENEEKVKAHLGKLQGSNFEILDYEKKKGKESAPKLFDLTSLQVEGNKKFNLSADETLKIAQSLYEKKFLSYPRVDTRYLPDDVYPKIGGILDSLKSYSELVKDVGRNPIRKSKNVFDNKKVTDHHAIIPTNVTANQLTGNEEKIYDLVVKRFLANFYPDCIISKTTVKGIASNINFKTTGKQILEPGWRTVYGKEKVEDDDAKDSKKEEETPTQLLPEFTKGENGPHEPLTEKKQTNPPKPFTEATLLRAMETAGKQVDDDEMRELMKENGIGRPSTRANIIETLFRRKYIAKQRKSIVPTLTGIELISTIKHDIIKSPELTGNWEKKIRDIELGNYDVGTFMKEMNVFVKEVVTHVKMDQSAVKIAEAGKKAPKQEKKLEVDCPKCKGGKILRGKTAYGCSAYASGCDFRLPVTIAEKELSFVHVSQLVNKQKTSNMKGLVISGKKVDGELILTPDFNIEIKEKKEKSLDCPVCRTGKIIKGSTAYGCSAYAQGCKFKIPFVVYEKKLSKSQINTLIKKRATNLIKGFKINGEKVNAKIVLNEANELKFLRE